MNEQSQNEKTILSHWENRFYIFEFVKKKSLFKNRQLVSFHISEIFLNSNEDEDKQFLPQKDVYEIF
jgi:hypothetical protein